jgi:ATP-dependent DNA helicase RecQ
MADESTGSEAFKHFERQKLDTLLGWCEITSCRRRPLLTYFGDALDEDCGNCDNCLQPPATTRRCMPWILTRTAIYSDDMAAGRGRTGRA